MTEYAYHPVSAEHEAGKVWIKEFFESEYPGFVVQFEVPILSSKRIADVAILQGSEIVHVGECQLAFQTTEQLDARTDDYEYEGISVDWFFGGSILGALSVKPWAIKRFGCFNAIDFKEAQVER